MKQARRLFAGALPYRQGDSALAACAPAADGKHVGKRGLKTNAARVVVPSAREIGPLFLLFTKCRSGATAIEYALIAALIAVVVVGAVRAAGGSLLSTMEYVGAAMERAAGFGAG